jgi:riboflavin synthase
MFTGLVEALGRLEEKRTLEGGEEIWIAEPAIAGSLSIGDSVLVSGTCLSVTAKDGGRFAVQAIRETLARTTLGALAPGAAVNLERPLRPEDRLGGHFVTGHVDATARVLAVEARGAETLVRVEIPRGYEAHFVEKGSVALDGVSLTVAGVGDADFVVYLIPITRERTTLGALDPGARVNVETDLLGKYILRMLAIGGDAVRSAAAGARPGALRGEVR